MGMLGCALVYVGFVLLINGIWLLGVLEDKHVIPMNLFTGVLIFAGVMRTVVWEGSNITSYFYSMQSLLFCFHLSMGCNQCNLESHGEGVRMVLPSSGDCRFSNSIYSIS